LGFFGTRKSKKEYSIEDITRIGGNYKRNSSRKSTSRRNIKSLRTRCPF
jgi:hypothetical protein